MARTVLVVFLTALAVNSLSSLAEPAEQTSTAAQSGAGSLSHSEKRLVKAVNAYRRRHNLEPLSVDPTLMRVARHAAPHFSHRVNGKWCWQRAKSAGFRGWATDDIASGHPTPEDAVQGWATSHGHAMQMRGYFKMNGRWCNYRFNRLGVGVAGRKYIAVFGRDDATYN
jgi:uncharacterized protein YkwD